MKSIIPFIFLLIICYTATAQVTNIPDPNFEDFLVETGIDSDGMINGQMATSDALAVTSLEMSYTSSDYPSGYISDLTGIEAFTNLENLTVNGTLAEELNVSTLINLKHLNCVDNMLTSLDVSNNPLLETLYLTYGGDVEPMNYFSEIDLSNNPQINKLVAYNIQYINLENGNNNPNIELTIPIFVMFGPPHPDEYGYTCIKVDDVSAAQNNEFPYSEWTISHAYSTYSFSNTCNLSTEDFALNNFSVYPNPTSDILNIKNSGVASIEKVRVFNITGKLVKEFVDFSSQKISLSDLEEGIYFLQLFSGSNIYTKKIVVN